MDDFDMFGDQTEVGEPGEHDLGLDDASEEAFYDPPPYEPPRNIISPDRSPIGQAFDTVMGFIPNPTTLKGAFDLGLGIFSAGTSIPAARFASGANTILNAASRTSPPSSSSTKGLQKPGPHPDEGRFDIAGAPPPPGALPSMQPEMRAAPPASSGPLPFDTTIIDSYGVRELGPVSYAAHMANRNPANQLASNYTGGETGKAIDDFLNKGVEFVGDLGKGATDFFTNLANPFTDKSQNAAGPSGKNSPFGPPTQTAERDPNKYGDQDGDGARDRLYPGEASAPVAQTELAPINPAAYENYFMGYDPDYDPYLAGFVGQPNLYGRREVVAEGGGGIMNLQRQANQLAAQGRGGDTMLMHMRPDEVAGLASLGGVTRNPSTGLPEGFLLPALGAFLPGMMGLGTGSILGGALATGLGAGAGQALQSKNVGRGRSS